MKGKKGTCEGCDRKTFVMRRADGKWFCWTCATEGTPEKKR